MLNFNDIENIPVQAVIRLGTKRMLVSELMKLTPGAIIDLNVNIGDLFVMSINGKDIAKGEIVNINNSYGFKIVELIK